ncbi:MAG: hypothetical protein LKE54_11750 [Prevotella sp.]|jgi:hypothetical protein|nr:hypothetical protein [Prevotella sp.]MCH3995686.1 hypothetical protein [Prevotella sp.]
MFFIVGSLNFSGNTLLGSNIYTLNRPNELYRTFNLPDILRLTNKYIDSKFVSLAMVVRVSLAITSSCSIIVFVIGIKLWFYQKHLHEYEKKQVENYKKIVPRINSVIEPTCRNMTYQEVSKSLDIGCNIRISNFDDANFYLKILYDYIYKMGTSFNLFNIYQVIHVIGYTDFLEGKLLKGKDREKSAAVQLAILLNLYINVSYVSRIINSENIPLRKQARLYYMMMNQEDTYKYIGPTDIELSLWDQMEIHHIFELCKLDNKPLPIFRAIVKLETRNVNKAFFIRETSYWGEDIEVHALIPYIGSPDEKIKRAAIKCMTERRVESAVNLIKKEAFMSSQHTVRLCLRSVLIIHKGNQTEFFSYFSQHASSSHTRRVALICLRLYDESSLKAYQNLYQQAKGMKKVTFEEVEESISQYKLYGGILNADNTLSIIKRYASDNI